MRIILEKVSLLASSYSFFFDPLLSYRVECWAGPKFDAGSAEKVAFCIQSYSSHLISQLDNSLCSSVCPGAEGESCGGQGVMDVWVTGSKNDGDE